MAHPQWGAAALGPAAGAAAAPQFNTNKVNFNELNLNQTNSTAKQIKTVLKKFKRRKGLGPDEVPMGAFKQLNADNK